MATIGMSSLSIAVTLARAQGYQMKVMDALKQGSAAIEGLMASTAKMFGDHVDRVVEFQSNPLIGVQALKASFDTVFAGLDKWMSSGRRTSSRWAPTLRCSKASWPKEKRE